MTWRFAYRRWDGTQDELVDDTDAVLSQLTDDLLANGDLHEALQRMLNRGWRLPDGRRVEGLRDLLDRIRLEREETLERGDLGGTYREIAEELSEVVTEERLGIEQLEADAAASGGGDGRRRRWPNRGAGLDDDGARISSMVGQERAEAWQRTCSPTLARRSACWKPGIGSIIGSNRRCSSGRTRLRIGEQVRSRDLSGISTRRWKADGRYRANLTPMRLAQTGGGGGPAC